MSTITIEPVTTTYDVTQFTITSAFTDITNNNVVITFDELDASSAVKATKTIVASGVNFSAIINMAAVQAFIINTENFVPV
jgi:hypothetical protein